MVSGMTGMNNLNLSHFTGVWVMVGRLFAEAFTLLFVFRWRQLPETVQRVKLCPLLRKLKSENLSKQGNSYWKH
jgi:hypothetical protein